MTNSRGFTLVEILIALVLMGIVGTALYQLLVANQRLYRAFLLSWRGSGTRGSWPR